jgi:hypothetical protein
MRTRMTAVAIGLLTLGLVAWTASAAPRTAPLEHFTAKAAQMVSLARITLRPVDIVITRWSTFPEQATLETALAEQGPGAFLDRLCDQAPAGTISTFDGHDITIRYAWQTFDRDGGRRIYLASDEPIALMGPMFRPSPRVEPFSFVELRLGPYDQGEGKLSEATRLSLDESRNVIEIRDYANRPLHLIEVRSLRTVEE